MLDQKNKEFLYAIFFMVLASAFIATTSIIAKILGKSDFGNSLNPLQISHSRFFFAFLFIALFSKVSLNHLYLYTINLQR